MTSGKSDGNGVFYVRNECQRSRNVSIWKACITIDGEIFNLGDKFISETEATKVYDRVAQNVRKARVLKRVAQDLIYKNHIDGTGVTPTEDEDIKKPNDAKVRRFNILTPCII